MLVSAQTADSLDSQEEEEEEAMDTGLGPRPIAGDGETLGYRQLVGMLVIVIIVPVFALTYKDSSLDAHQHLTLAVFCVVLVLWVTEVIPIPITGMLVGPLLFLCGVMSLKDALSSYMTNLTMIVFGSAFIALAMERHGLHRRLAVSATSLPMVKGIPWRERLAVMLSGWGLSMWVSNTGATNILVPIALSTVGAERNKPLHSALARRTLTGSLLSVAYGCNSGGMATLVGTPANLVAERMLTQEGVEIGFLSWMLIGVPASSLVCAVAFLILLQTHKPTRGSQKAKSSSPLGQGGDSSESSEEEEDEESNEAAKLERLGPMKWGEKVVLASFLVIIFFWVLPAMYKLAGGAHPKELKALLPAGVVVLIGTVPMQLIPDVDGKTRVLPWSEAKKADWGIVMLLGGGVALGRAMLDTGMAKILAEGILAFTGITSVWSLTFLAVFMTIFVTEVVSNTATTNLLVPIVLAISKSLDPDPKAATAPVIGVALAASSAFMMPIATPPNYIVTETGHVTMAEMARAGILVNLVCVVLLWCVLRLIAPALT